MTRYGKVRTVIVVVLCGSAPVAWAVLVDRESAARSVTWWVVFLAGLLVIAVGGIVIGSSYVKRRLRRRRTAAAAPVGLPTNTSAVRRGRRDPVVLGLFVVLVTVGCPGGSRLSR